MHLKPVQRTLVISHHQAWRFVGGQAVFVEFLKHTRNPMRLTISVFEVDPKNEFKFWYSLKMCILAQIKNDKFVQSVIKNTFSTEWQFRYRPFCGNLRKSVKLKGEESASVIASVRIKTDYLFKSMLNFFTPLSGARFHVLWLSTHKNGGADMGREGADGRLVSGVHRLKTEHSDPNHQLRIAWLSISKINIQ